MSYIKAEDNSEHYCMLERGHTGVHQTIIQWYEEKKEYLHTNIEEEKKCGNVKRKNKKHDRIYAYGKKIDPLYIYKKTKSTASSNQSLYKNELDEIINFLSVWRTHNDIQEHIGADRRLITSYLSMLKNKLEIIQYGRKHKYRINKLLQQQNNRRFGNGEIIDKKEVYNITKTRAYARLNLYKNEVVELKKYLHEWRTRKDIIHYLGVSSPIVAAYFKILRYYNKLDEMNDETLGTLYKLKNLVHGEAFKEYMLDEGDTK